MPSAVPAATGDEGVRLALQRGFALALLDSRADGVVVSSLHTRAATRVYAKAIRGGRSDGALSSEETEAIRQAIQHGSG